MTATIAIRTASDLARLLEPRHGWRGISVEVPGLDGDAARSWSDRLAHDYSGCGCDTGQYFGIAGLIAAGSWLWFGSGGWWGRGAGAFAILAFAAVAGKAAGLLIARRHLRRSIAALAPLLPA